MPPLAAGASPLRVLLVAAIALVARGEVEQLLKFGASDGTANDHFGSSVSMSGDGRRVAVGATGVDGNRGSVYVYSFDGAATMEHSIKLEAEDGAAGDYFGSSVCISEDGGRVAVGAVGDAGRGTNSGCVYIFDVATGQQLFKVTAWDGGTNHYFGSWKSLSVSADGNRVVIGAYGHASFRGSAYLFDFSGAGTTLKQLFAPWPDDNFGASVSLSEDGGVVAVGAPRWQSVRRRYPTLNYGAVYLFDGTSGEQFSGGLLHAPSPDLRANLLVGSSVAISKDGGMLAAGGDGLVYLFDTATKLLSLSLRPMEGEANDQFGHTLSLSLDGSLAAVGAYQDSSSRGSIYVFDTITGAQLSKLTASSGAAGDQFGYSLSSGGAGSQLAVGAWKDDDTGSDAGSVYLFGDRSLWTVTTSTVTPVRCTAGYFPDGGVCSPCPEGTSADAGSYICLPLVSNVLSSIQTPELSIANDGPGVVRMAVAVSELPAELAAGVTLRYAVDMSAPEEESTRQASACSAPWTTSPPQLTAALSYDHMVLTCGFGVFFSEDSIELRGVLYIHLLRTSSDGTTTVAAQWPKPLVLSFPRSVTGANDFVDAIETVLMSVMGGQGEINVTQFGSELVLYATPDYEDTLNPLETYYREGDSAFLQHSLQPEVRGLNLLPEMAWLSESEDPTAPAIHNLAISSLGNGEEARFSVTVTECEQCVLFVASRVIVEEGRRLAREEHALGKMLMDVAPAEVVEAIEAEEDEAPPLEVENEVVEAVRDGAPSLIIHPFVAVFIAMVASLLMGLVTLFFQKLSQSRTGARIWNPLAFLWVELGDIVSDTAAYVWCAGAGDLEFDNDEPGLLNLAIMLSTIISAALFFFEVASWCCFRQEFRGWIPYLMCIHLVGEDFFQLVLYSFVAASQAAEGVKDGTILVGLVILLCLVFVLTKFKDFFCTQETVG